MQQLSEPSAPFEQLLNARHIVETEIAPGHPAPNRLRPLWNDLDQDKWRAESESAFLPAVKIVAVPEIELRSDYLPYENAALVFLQGVYPNYVKDYHEKGLLPTPIDVQQVRRVEEPTFCVSHFSMATYGHFLVEVLPKILLALELRDAGMPARIAFPSDAGAISEIVKAICPEQSLLMYESKAERLQLRVSLHPSLMFGDQMHDLFVALARLLVLRMTMTPSESAPVGKRLFLSRQKWMGYRTVSNEAELFEVAESYGFRLVHPQDFSWPDQLRIFAGASDIIGAYNSALHGALFSPAGTKVISFARVNCVQDGIGASLGHQVGYIQPSVGSVSFFNPHSPQPEIYEVSPLDLRKRLDALSLRPCQ